MRNQRRQTLQAATAEVRLGPAESARFSGSVASNEALLPLYRQRVRFTIAQTCQRGDFGHEIAENRANVGLQALIDPTWSTLLNAGDAAGIVRALWSKIF